MKVHSTKVKSKGVSDIGSIARSSVRSSTHPKPEKKGPGAKSAFSGRKKRKEEAKLRIAAAAASVPELEMS